MGSLRRRTLMQLIPEPPITYTGFYVEDVSGNPNTLTIVQPSAWGGPALTIETSLNGRAWTVLGTTSTTPLTTVVPP